jgi:hypothetical protein
VKTPTTKEMIEKEKNCPTLCVDCKSQCELYLLWLKRSLNCTKEAKERIRKRYKDDGYLVDMDAMKISNLNPDAEELNQDFD